MIEQIYSTVRSIRSILPVFKSTYMHLNPTAEEVFDSRSDLQHIKVRVQYVCSKITHSTS
jgi:hypothetical protein